MEITNIFSTKRRKLQKKWPKKWGGGPLALRALPAMFTSGKAVRIDTTAQNHSNSHLHHAFNLPGRRHVGKVSTSVLNSHRHS